VFLALVVAAATTPPGAGWTLASYGLALAMVLIAARVSLGYVATRAAIIMPFVALAAASAPFLKGGQVLWSARVLGVELSVYEHGLRIAGNVLARSCVALAGLITLTSVTPMEQLLESLRRLRTPAVAVMLAGFAYRYIFLLVDEAQRLRIARDSRTPTRVPPLRAARTLGRMVGALFVRSFERAERVHRAMLARGYDGRRRPAGAWRLGWRDVAFLAGGLLAIGALRSSPLWLQRLL